MWIDRQAEPRTWRRRLLAASLLVCGAVGLATMLRWRGVLWFALPVVAPCVLLPRPLVYVRLRAILLVFGAVVAFLVVQALAPVSDFQPELLGRLDVVCPILLSIGAVAALHSFTTLNTLLLVGSSYGMIVLSGLAGMALGGDYMRFSIVTGTYVLALIAFLHSVRRPRRLTRTGWRLRVVHLALVGASVIVSCVALPFVRDGAFTLYGRMVSASMFMLRDVVAMHSSRVLDLYQVVPKDFGQRSAVLLRVVSDELPGYLRGNGYDTYRDGRWLPGSEFSPVSGRSVNSKLKRFSLASPTGKASATPIRTMTIHRAPGYSSLAFHLPPQTEELTAPLSSLRRDVHGTVIPGDRSAKPCRSYSLTHPAAGLLAADQSSSAEVPSDCLVIPEALRADLQTIAAPIFSGTDEGGTAAKLRALSTFFADNFRYELGISMAADRDPILQFLQDKRRGHCSFFAASTALLLRTQGIPTRVVTGFVCAERHPGGNYWVARERTAHAWVEAFVRESGQWVLVDNTPEDGRPQRDSQFSHASALMDSIRFWRQRLLTLFQQLPPGEIMALAARQIAAWVGLLMGSARRVIAIALLLAACVVSLWLNSRRMATPSLVAARHAACLREFDRLLRRIGIRRSPRQTVRRAVEDAADLPPPLRAETLSAISRYEDLRYRPGGGTADTAQALKADIRSIGKGRHP